MPSNSTKPASEWLQRLFQAKCPHAPVFHSWISDLSEAIDRHGGPYDYQPSASARRMFPMTISNATTLIIAGGIQMTMPPICWSATAPIDGK